jgi:hypothetical protein
LTTGKSPSENLRARGNQREFHSLGILSIATSSILQGQKHEILAVFVGGRLGLRLLIPTPQMDPVPPLHGVK